MPCLVLIIVVFKKRMMAPIRHRRIYVWQQRSKGVDQSLSFVLRVYDFDQYILYHDKKFVYTLTIQQGI